MRGRSTAAKELPMTAGGCATPSPRESVNAPITHALLENGAYTPRPLARGKCAAVVHVFFSPDVRVLAIADAVNACRTLKPESTVAQYVERPLRLQIGPREHFELESLTRHVNGGSCQPARLRQHDAKRGSGPPSGTGSCCSSPPRTCCARSRRCSTPPRNCRRGFGGMQASLRL